MRRAEMPCSGPEGIAPRAAVYWALQARQAIAPDQSLQGGALEGDPRRCPSFAADCGKLLASGGNLSDSPWTGSTCLGQCRWRSTTKGWGRVSKKNRLSFASLRDVQQ